MGDDSWMDEEAVRLQEKADGLVREYQQVERRAALTSGDRREELLEKLSMIAQRHNELINQISRLRYRTIV